jgi:hypothetical protein
MELRQSVKLLVSSGWYVSSVFVYLRIHVGYLAPRCLALRQFNII